MDAEAEVMIGVDFWFLRSNGTGDGSYLYGTTKGDGYGHGYLCGIPDNAQDYYYGNGRGNGKDCGYGYGDTLE